MSVPPANAAQSCGHCGQPLAPGAAFCRNCGERAGVTAPAAPTPEPAAGASPPGRGGGGWGRPVALAAVAGLLLGGGFAAAMVLLGGDDSEPAAAVAPGSAATIPVAEERVTTESGEAESPAEVPGVPPPPPAGSVEAGRYVQAGSFRTVEGAEEEQLRLAASAVHVSVIESDQAQDLYPGFQVLVAGPFASRGAERSAVKQLHENGVPSAFARDLGPAATIAGAEEIAGRWTGTLERSGSEQTGRNGSLPVALTGAADGDTAELDFSSLNCETSLELESETAVALTYEQQGECVGGGQWHLRPNGASLDLALLPPDSDVIVVGKLTPE